MVALRLIAAFHLALVSGRSMRANERTVDTSPPATSPQTTATADLSLAAGYLNKYGYIAKSSNGRTAALNDLNSAVKDFQVFAGLPPTGVLDEQTLQKMAAPRCGVQDKDNYIIQVNEAIKDSEVVNIKHRDKNKTRHRRFVIQGSRWKVRDLTYAITKYPTSSRLSRAEVDRTFRKAFDVWEKFTNLKFEEKTSGKVHIDIRFEKRSHGDDDPFDGEGGTLAHAFFPIYGGDAHFDDEEYWTVDKKWGTSLLMSAAHELGHSLGLSHSSVNGALMAPFYRGYEEDLSLGVDDIEGIEALYGEKSDEDNNVQPQGGNRKSGKPKNTAAPTVPTPRTTTTPSAPKFDNRELCNNGPIDVIVTMKDNVTYAFKGRNYWKLTETSIADGYPRPISKDWDGLPSNLDAALTWTNGRTYFFKGSMYWRFTNGRMDRDYPKSMHVGFGGIPYSVDAAVVRPSNNKIYFFKGTKYWKFDPESPVPVQDTYPRDIDNWDGIPNYLDSVMKYSNGQVYFFKNGVYYRWNDNSYTVDTADPPYPRDTGLWWFGCKSSPLKRISS